MTFTFILFVLDNPGGFAQLGAYLLLHLIAAVATIRLYQRAGHGWAWAALLGLSPVVAAPFAMYAIFQGYATPEEALWLLAPLFAGVPAMLVGLAFRRWIAIVGGCCLLLVSVAMPLFGPAPRASTPDKYVFTTEKWRRADQRCFMVGHLLTYSLHVGRTTREQAVRLLGEGKSQDRCLRYALGACSLFGDYSLLVCFDDKSKFASARWQRGLSGQ